MPEWQSPSWLEDLVILREEKVAGTESQLVIYHPYLRNRVSKMRGQTIKPQSPSQRTSDLSLKDSTTFLAVSPDGDQLITSMHL